MGNGLAPPPGNVNDFRNIDIPGSPDGSVLVKIAGIWNFLIPGSNGQLLGISAGAPTYLTVSGLTIPIPVVDGGTGATTAAGARTNLGGLSRILEENLTAASIANTLQRSDLLNILVTGLVEGSRIETQFTDIGELTNNSVWRVHTRTADVLTVGFTVSPGAASFGASDPSPTNRLLIEGIPANIHALRTTQAPSSNITRWRADNTIPATVLNTIEWSAFANITTTGLVEASRIETQFSDVGETTNDSVVRVHNRFDDVLGAHLAVRDDYVVVGPTANADLRVETEAALVVSDTSGSGASLFQEFRDGAGVRMRIGQRLTAIPTNSLTAEIVTNSAGDTNYIARSDISGVGHVFYEGSTTPNPRVFIGGQTGNTSAEFFFNASTNIDFFANNPSAAGRSVFQGAAGYFLDIFSGAAASVANSQSFRNFGNITTTGLVEQTRIESTWTDVGETTNDSDLQFHTRINDVLTHIGKFEGAGSALLISATATDTAKGGSGLYVINATAGIGGALNNASSGEWRIRTDSGIAAFGSTVPAATGLMSNNVVRLVNDSVTGRFAVGHDAVASASVVPSSMWTALSTTEGARPAPQMTTAQRLAITPLAAAQEGILVDDTDVSALFRWSGTAWQQLAFTGMSVANTAVSATTTAMGAADIYRATAADITITISRADIIDGREFTFKGRNTGISVGTPVTIDTEGVTISSAALAAGSGTDFTASSPHNFVIGTRIVHGGFGGQPTYNGSFVVTAIPSTTVYEVAAITFVATDTGTANTTIDGAASSSIEVDDGGFTVFVVDGQLEGKP